jgi:hypothetical protein
MNTAIVREYSGRATRNHPWERWVERSEPKLAVYMGITVEVVQELTLCALVRRPDGFSCIVETSDLIEVEQ